MPSLLPLLLLTATLNADTHLEENALYRELREKGVPIGADIRAPLPAPLMADGLDAKTQRALLEKLAGDYPLEEYLRKSVVAPHVYSYRDVKPSAPEAPAHANDLWFIAHGDLDKLAKQDATGFFQSVRKEVKVHVLTDEELAHRGLKGDKSNGKQVRHVHTTYPLLEKVQVETTSKTVMTRTPDSLLLATALDAGFAKDEQFPNQWRAILREGGDEFKLGPPHPYDGNGLYMKVTRLHEPKGALFVEYHRISTEPKKWFNGANLLRSKLPILIQSEVRSFRRELKEEEKD